jgi:hypothetical protein
MVYSGAWGKLIHEKKPEVENLVPLSLWTARQRRKVVAACFFNHPNLFLKVFFCPPVQEEQPGRQEVARREARPRESAKTARPMSGEC